MDGMPMGGYKDQAPTKQVEGIPVGYKLVRFGIPVKGEVIASPYVPNGVYTSSGALSSASVIVALDNVYNKNLDSVTIPEGYERNGEKVEEWFRIPVVGDEYISVANMGVGHFGLPEKSGYHTIGPDHRRIILRAIKPKTKRVLVIECPVGEGEEMLGVTVSVGKKPQILHTQPERRLYLADVTSHVEERPL